MISVWYLVLFMKYSYAGGVVTIPMANKESCVDAANWYQGRFAVKSASCVEGIMAGGK
jgi:hypothetical protein